MSWYVINLHYLVGSHLLYLQPPSPATRPRTDRHHPEGAHDGEVEGRDARAHAEGLPDLVRVHALPDARDVATHRVESGG